MKLKCGALFHHYNDEMVKLSQYHQQYPHYHNIYSAMPAKNHLLAAFNNDAIYQKHYDIDSCVMISIRIGYYTAFHLVNETLWMYFSLFISIAKSIEEIELISILYIYMAARRADIYVIMKAISPY